ncbi:MAG: ABC transporter ATP-binding protein [Planctomycetota bacterium]
MSEEKPVLEYQSKRRPKKERRRYVWRAVAYLRPYKRQVIVSIVCAFFAGGAFFGGLGAFLPVLQTLLNGDTPRMWVDRMVAEQRWGIDLADDPSELQIIDDSGLEMELTISSTSKRTNKGVWPKFAGDDVEQNLSSLASGTPSDLAPYDTDVVPYVNVPRGAIVSDYGSSTTVRQNDVSLHLRLLRRVVYLLPSSPVGAAAWIMGIALVLNIVSNLFRFVQEFISNKVALSAVNDIRRDLYDHTLRTPIAGFGRTGTGDVTSRIIGDAAQLQEGLRTLLGRAVQEPILALFGLAFALWLDWRLTLLVIGFAPIMLLVLKRFGKKMRRAGRKALEENAELLGQIEGTLTGIKIVKANNAEAAEVGRLRVILDSLLGFQLRLARYDALSTPVMGTLATLAIGVVFVVAIYLVRIDQSLSAASAIMVFASLVQIAESVRRISKLNVVLSKANAAGERVFEMIDLPVESQRSQRREDTKSDAKSRADDEVSASEPSLTFASDFASSRLRDLRVDDQISFDSVTFAYAEHEPPALQDVSLSVQAGESVAVVGRNGSGKTTLLSMLPRFYDPTSGRVTIDGTDVRELDLAELRQLIGVVTQDAHVFAGTIAHNIAYGRPDATREEIIDAAKQAEAHEFIQDKPSGYDAFLSGLGGQLSGGQRQRLNIARAILRDPPVLILDEATSQVDAQSEHLIQQAIGRLMKGRTTFVIAHRFSTILDCDRIAVLNAGRLVAVGPHDELLDTSDVYRDLYERQLVTA